MTQPYSKKEKLLVEYLLSDRTIFMKCYSILKPSYFDSPIDKVVKFALDFFAEYHTTPNEDVVDAETGVSLTYRDILPGEQEYVLEEIEDLCSREAMSQAILDSVDLVNEGNMAQVQELVRDALSVKIDKKLGTDVFEDIKIRIERSREERKGYKLGIDAIDDINGGTWHRGEMYMFAAPTSGGKSVILANVVDRMSSQGLDALIISVEMDEDPYAGRLDSIISGLAIGSDVDSLVNSLEDKKDQYGRITIKRVNNKFGLEDLRTYLMEYHLQYGKYPDLVALDYIDIFANGTHLNKLSVFDRDEIKSHSFRDIMIEYNMMGFTACQLNRDAYQDVISISIAHIQGGISKAQACEAVISMVATDEDMENDQLQLKGIKIRNASKSPTPVTIYRCAKTLRLSDTPFSLDTPKASKSPVTKLTQKSKDAKVETPPSKAKSKLDQALKMSRG